MLLVIGSKHSLLPRICDVLAVGIGASSSELRMPQRAMSAFSVAQSQRPLSVLSATSHMSYCSRPSEAGEPTNVVYAPRHFVSASSSGSSARCFLISAARSALTAPSSSSRSSARFLAISMLAVTAPW